MIDITFDNSTKEACAFGLTQWDKGQKLRILWTDMPESFQVHFSSRGSQEAVVVSAEGKSGEAIVEIPDSLLKNSADIFAWIYLTENSDVGESVKRAVLYVRPRAKPHTSVDDLEPTQQELLESILADVNENLKYIKENGGDAEYVPEYVQKGAEAVAKKVASLRNENSVVFLAVSDAHLKSGDYNSESSVKHMSQAMKIIAERCPLDFVAYLGDMTSGGTDKAITDGESEIISVNAALFPAASHVTAFRCTGSEDSLNKGFYRNGDYIRTPMLYNLIGKWNKDMISPEGKEIRGYGYKDFEKEKIRVICLNTSDTHGADLLPYSNTAVMSGPQLQWFCEALDLSAKSDSGKWGIIILGHHPLNMLNKFALAKDILDAYVSGSAIDLATSEGDSVAYNFSGKNSAKILGQFHGHLHNYRVNFMTSSNIPLVTVPNAGFYDNNFYTDAFYTNDENNAYAETVTYDKTVNTVTDTALCVMVIDKVSGEINALHYGAGIDRTIKGTEVSNGPSTDSGSGDNSGDSGDNDNDDNNTNVNYSNLVPRSITSSGNIYNNCGYSDDNKLILSGDISYGEGYTHTGFIRVNRDDCIRVSGVNFNGSTGCSLIAYDGNFTFKWSVLLTGAGNAANGISYTDTGVLIFRPANAQSSSLSEIAYIRVSAVGQGQNLIVTANEDIDGSTEIEPVTPPTSTYTNIVQFGVDMVDSPYGEHGYKDNYSITATGSGQKLDGYTASGYLDIDIDAVIRITGVTFDGSNGCYLAVYDASKKKIRVINLTGVTDEENGIVVENSIVKFTPADINADLSAISKFRVSGKGNGENLIITYNEEIV